MTQEEKQEIRQLPSEYQPLSAWAYWGLSILYAIPVIGQIILIVHALSGSNVNRRSYARSYFCSLILVLIIWCIILAFGGLTVITQYLVNNSWFYLTLNLIR